MNTIFLFDAAASPAQSGIPMSRNLIYWPIQLYGGESVTSGPLFLLLGVVLCAVTAYLIGSVSPILLYCRIRYHEDIRTLGNRRADAFNVYLVYGLKDALLCMLPDIGLSLLAVFAGLLLMAQDGAAIAFFFCVLGHIFPLYFKFRGGLGMTCMLFAPLLLNLPTFFIMLAFFVMTMLLARYYTLSSVMYAIVLPLFLRAFCKNQFYADWYLYMSLLNMVFAIVVQWKALTAMLRGQGVRFEIGKKHIPLKRQETAVSSQEGKHRD